MIKWLTILQLMGLVIMMMISVAFFSLMERKILSYLHFRKGPNKVSLVGFLQPFSDALKLLTKDDSKVTWSNTILYYVSPMFMMFLSLICWWAFPHWWGCHSHNSSMLFVMLVLGATVYGPLVSGWASNSKYAILGSMRMVSTSISYEVLMSFTFLILMFIFIGVNMKNMFSFSLASLTLMMPPVFILMVISSLAELNRSPFDLAEGESELVAGYTVEYGGAVYTIIFLSENMMIFFTCFMISFFSFNFSFTGSTVVFSSLSVVVCLIRGIVPRIRYDNLMHLCWCLLLPLALVFFNFYVVISFLI